MTTLETTPETPQAYPTVPAHPAFPALEHEVLDFWAADGTFEAVGRRAPDRRERRQRVRLLRRPTVRQRPAALRPPAHRLRQGRRAALPAPCAAAASSAASAGTTHGLPAEVEAEHQLGIKHKSEIEEMGVAAVQRRLPRLGAALHRRVARLRHPPGPLGRLRQRLQDARPGLHGERHVGLQDPVGQGPRLPGFRVLWYCWRCETPLSSTETKMDDVYTDRQDPAVTVGLRLSAPGPSSRRRVRPDLDDDAVDAAVEPGRRRASGRRVRAGRDGRLDGAPRRAVRARRRPASPRTPGSWARTRACCAA